MFILVKLLKRFCVGTAIFLEKKLNESKFELFKAESVIIIIEIKGVVCWYYHESHFQINGQPEFKERII